MKQCLLRALQLVHVRRSVISILLLMGVSVAVQPASADPILYTRAQFDAAFPGAVTEPWEDYAAGTIFPDGTTTNGITYSVNNGDAIVTGGFLATTPPNTLGRTPNNFFLNGDVATFSFNDPLSAFGIDFNTFATEAGAYTATTSAGEVIASMFDPFPGFATGQFLGFSTTETFTSIAISNGAATDTFTLDTLRRVLGAPEPVPIPITCGFGPEGSGGSGCGDSENPYSNTFIWEDYFVELTLVGGVGSFNITLTDNPTSQGAFEDRLPADFAGYRCIPVVDPDSTDQPCRDFAVEAPFPNLWSTYEIKFDWEFEWEGLPASSGPTGPVTILHDIGHPSPDNPNWRDNGADYDEDMCLAYGNCVYEPHPGIRSGDTDFKTFIPSLQPAAVPEPGSLILMATGAGGILYRRRRRRREF